METFSCVNLCVNVEQDLPGCSELFNDLALLLAFLHV